MEVSIGGPDDFHSAGTFGHKLYALAEGGTLLYPRADGALHPGAYASLGMGVENAR